MVHFDVTRVIIYENLLRRNMDGTAVTEWSNKSCPSQNNTKAKLRKLPFMDHFVTAAVSCLLLNIITLGTCPACICQNLMKVGGTSYTCVLLSSGSCYKYGRNIFSRIPEMSMCRCKSSYRRTTPTPSCHHTALQPFAFSAALSPSPHLLPQNSCSSQRRRR